MMPRAAARRRLAVVAALATATLVAGTGVAAATSARSAAPGQLAAQAHTAGQVGAYLAAARRQPPPPAGHYAPLGSTGLVAHPIRANVAGPVDPMLAYVHSWWVSSTVLAREVRIRDLRTTADVVVVAASTADCPNEPRISPDGTLLAYLDFGNQCSGNGLLQVVNLSSAAVSTVVAGAASTGLYLPNWSPDSSKILYTVETFSGQNYVNSALFTVPAAGGPPTPVAGAGANADGGVYSPDGTKIVFAPTSPVSNNFLAVMAADGTAVTILTKTALNPTYWPTNAAWSPDGTKVSFTYLRSTVSNANGTFGFNGIGAAAVDNSSAKGLLVTSDARYCAFYSSWSADGTEIFYDMLVRDLVTGSTVSSAAEYVTDAGGTRRATIISGNDAFYGSAFVGPSVSIGLPSTYTPLTTPVRMLPKTTLGPNGTYDLQITGATVPTGSTAVTLNLTGVNPVSYTHLTLPTILRV